MLYYPPTQPEARLMKNIKVLAIVAAVVCSAQTALAVEIPQSLTSRLSEAIPGTAPDLIQASEISGIFEVHYGASIYYVSADGRYLLRGDLIDLEEKTNLTENRRALSRKIAIDKLDEKGMIVFSPDAVKHTVTVFTDVDCPYCAKFHQQMAEYNGRGVRVRYLAFPRAGIHSESYFKTVSVWCSDDPRQAIGDAKFGKPVAEKTCINPVAEHYNLGQTVGVNGTPTIVLDSGEVIPGYVPPERLLDILEGRDSG
jgi:thiol:disulfide interchange protein DsbC